MPVHKHRELSTSINLIEALGFEDQVVRLKEFILNWVYSCDKEIRKLFEWQLLGSCKFYRPITIFACHQSVSARPIDDALIQCGAAVELIHNVSLIIDDILDRSRVRRGRQTLHCKFGSLPALMAAGYITAESFNMVNRRPYAVQCLAELLERLAVAECLQWRLRKQPLGVNDWVDVAAEDTGSMFEICARVGTSNYLLSSFGRLLGILYHGCDDVADARGTLALGGGGEEDLRDGILTLPIAVAMHDPEVALQFRNGSPRDRIALKKKIVSALPSAENFLDGIAKASIDEARRVAADARPLTTLVRYTRLLSAA